jgi:RNA polymerase sigma factor (sigma-70 family)
MNLDLVPNVAALDDARLVELGLDGDRDAFGQLVVRYQSPVCALAYSGCGDISQSEDLAQETFIVAWRKLGDLKEPTRFKSWVYGITRNLTKNAFRRQIRNPLATAEPLDESLTATAAASNPPEQAISKEEKEILWRSLEHIPEIYREPLILFYREDQSIERVAAILDLSEDAVRQRLSRGRKLLNERVAAVVEGALQRSAPGPAFTLGVLAALPAMTISAKAATLGAAAKGGAAGKSVAAVGVFAILKAVLIKAVPAAAGTWLMLKLPESKRERRFALKSFGFLWAVSILYVLGLILGIHLAAINGYWDAHPRAMPLVILGVAIGFVGFVGPYTFWIARVQRRIQKEEAGKSADAGFISISQPYEYRSPYTLLGLPLVHIRWHCEESGKGLAAKGWIACGNRAYGIIFASGTFAVGCVSIGALAIGLLAVGGFGIGLLAFGGMSAGIAAMGGVSIGYIAFGGGAIGWLGAYGGGAIARHFAVGGALAEHANDQAAYDFMNGNFFFRNAWRIFNTLVLISWLLPGLTTLYYKRWRRKHQAAPSEIIGT